MAANITPAAVRAVDVLDELDELETRPMTDSEHLATFGWAWDDPDLVEVEA